MNTTECIKTRYSIREYSDAAVSEGLVKEILQAAVCAPSAGNAQDWEFIVVRKQEIKKQLAEAALGQGFIADAPVLVVVCSNLKKIGSAYGERGVSLYSIQDTAAAAMCLMLAAWEKGLGTCWVGAFDEGRVKEILVLPMDVRPLAIITLGYPRAGIEKPKSRDLSGVLHWEHYGGAE